MFRAEAHGQVARELAEPYYLYGKALLELARYVHKNLPCSTVSMLILAVWNNVFCHQLFLGKRIQF